MLVPIIPLAALALSGAPAVSAGDASTYETNFDTDALVEVTLASPTDETVSVHWATTDGTASSEDYLPDSGTLTFAPGERTKRIAVLIKGDALDEPDETFFVDLSGAEHATIERGRATVTIIDSDPAPYRLLDAWVDVRWSVHKNYTRVLKLAIHRPARTLVHVRCRGAGCPARVGRKLRPGALVDVRIEALYQPLIGRVYQYRIRAGKAPLFTARCLLPGSSTPSSC